MSLWFMSAAILPDLTREFAISDFAQAALSSAVQIGFVVGAVVLGPFRPRRPLSIHETRVCHLRDSRSPVQPQACSCFEPGGPVTIFARFATGVLLAGVYPVGMKIAVGWGTGRTGACWSARWSAHSLSVRPRHTCSPSSAGPTGAGA